MKKLFVLLSCAAFIILLVFDLIFTFKIKETINLLQESDIQISEKIDFLNKEINLLTETVSSNSDEIKASLFSIQQDVLKNAKEISATGSNLKYLNGRYSDMLSELQKKTLDVSKTDDTSEKMRADALYQYSNKNYNECLTLCNKILAIQSDDISIRRLKVKALYYRNPLDSSKFDELLSDIDIVINAYGNDKEINEIKKNIMAERGVLDEE